MRIIYPESKPAGTFEFPVTVRWKQMDYQVTTLGLNILERFGLWLAERVGKSDQFLKWLWSDATIVPKPTLKPQSYSDGALATMINVQKRYQTILMYPREALGDKGPFTEVSLAASRAAAPKVLEHLHQEEAKAAIRSGPYAQFFTKNPDLIIATITPEDQKKLGLDHDGELLPAIKLLIAEGKAHWTLTDQDIIYVGLSNTEFPDIFTLQRISNDYRREELEAALRA